MLAPTAQVLDFRSEVGAGFQYGGAFGYQGSLYTHSSSLNVGVGFIGSTLGYEFAATDKISVGAQIYLIGVPFSDFTFTGGRSVYENYHFSSVSTAGWVLGIDVFERGPQGDEEEGDNGGAFASLGYRFLAV
ncbi:MAG: hypothetical protein AB8B87_21045 [Granulosicoccus sp.]